MRKTAVEISDDYRARAAAFIAFAVETISPELREELFMLADGFELLATKSVRDDRDGSGQH